MLEVTYIRDIADIAHFVAQMLQIAVENVKCDSGTSMPQMCIAIHSRAADIHAYVPFVQGFECFFESGERIIDF